MTYFFEFGFGFEFGFEIGFEFKFGFKFGFKFWFEFAGHRWSLLVTAWHICANFATCSREPLTMLNPHFVAGEHGSFWGHESEDIRTIFI